VYRRRHETRRSPKPKLHQENSVERATRVSMSRCRNSVKNCFFTQDFTEIGQSAAELWPKTISNMAAVRHLELWKFSYLVMWQSSITKCAVIPNFIKIGWFLGKRQYVTSPYGMRRLSVICLWRCCTRLRGLSFLSNILHPLNSLKTSTVCVKIRKGCRWSCKLNGRGYEKLAFFDQYVVLCRKQYKVRPTTKKDE